MSDNARVTVSAITADDVPAVARFLHEYLNSRLSPSRWAAAITPRWAGAGPNHGFKLETGGAVVGVNLAFYSSRPTTSGGRRFCNLAALCVLPEARVHTVRLVRALLGQPGYVFTDLSPSGNVIEMDRRLGFVPIDTTTAAVVNVPGRRPAGLRLLTDPEDVRACLQHRNPRLVAVFDDHRDMLAARHLLLVSADRCSYVVYRRDRRKRLPIFASLLHVSDPQTYVAGAGLVASHLLRRGALVTLAERRLLDGLRPPGLGLLFRARPKLYRGAQVSADQVDYLYSELTCVPW